MGDSYAHSWSARTLTKCSVHVHRLLHDGTLLLDCMAMLTFGQVFDLLSRLAQDSFVDGGAGDLCFLLSDLLAQALDLLPEVLNQRCLFSKLHIPASYVNLAVGASDRPL